MWQYAVCATSINPKPQHKMRAYTIRYLILIAITALLFSCRSDELPSAPVPDHIPEGYVEVFFEAQAPHFSSQDVRAVDPDGVDVQNLSLFCFNDFGLFITISHAEINPVVQVPSLSGTYRAVIPEDTRIIHFVANQNPNLYSSEQFVNRSEDDIHSEMVGASGMIIYWSRFVRDGEGTIQEQLKAENGGEGIKLIRNQAKISIANWQTSDFVVTGFVATNIHAFGTTAPYHPTYRFPTPGTEFEWPGDEMFVTLPENRAMMSDITDVNTKSEDYVFEHENSYDNPVSVIIRGHKPDQSEDLYYRVMIVDEDGEQLMIRRNHHYIINLSGALSFGQKSFEAALSAPASNNVWVAVDDWVNKISDGDYTLSVEETSIVLDDSQEGTAYTVVYNISRSGGQLTAEDMAQVSWLEGNNVAAHTFNHTFDPATGEGRITVQILDMSDPVQQSGKLLIKSGRLQRNVEIIMIKTHKFTPCWVATQIYGGNVGEFATMKFTIPESFPRFPFTVLISVNSLDVRADSGMVLPILVEGEEGYFGIDNGLGYKYAYTVTAPGSHRIYMHNILQHDEGETDSITIEAEYFETITKEFVYAGHHNAIRVYDLSHYTTTGDGEGVYYKLVPRKINAPVLLDVRLEDVSAGEGSNSVAIDAEPNDEFILYSRTLDTLQTAADRAMFSLPADQPLGIDFYPVDDAYWQQSSNGRMFIFKPTNVVSEYGTGHYHLYLKTNSSNSADVVRVASNKVGSPSGIPANAGAEYDGNTYRAFIFELENYRPFRFAAQISASGGEPQGTWGEGQVDAEPVDEVSWTYEPEQQIDIMFDVTSFVGSDGGSPDPFGVPFEIYIDAPMLRIDKSRLAECNLNSSKLVASPDVKGRFIYYVDSSREVERTFGSGEGVKYIDTTGADQTGERKRLPFITTGITSAGEIKLSSNNQKVIFYDKIFEVSNSLIEGNIQYLDQSTYRDVPKDAFVSFALRSTGVRIGSMNITSDGHYKLNLRGEYEFDWVDDELELDYILTDRVYTAYIDNLATVYDMAERGQTITLEYIE